MQSMFNTARAFNQDIGGWNTSKVTNMNNMLRWTDNFNQDISGWDVSNVTSTYRMFSGSSFNIPIGSWNVSKVSNMQEMFSGAWAFNQPLNNWNVSNVTNMNSMFDGASSFNQPLNTWDVSNVTNMGNMFNYAFDFNQDISGWDVSKVTTFRWMFRYCDAFNQPIGNWNTSSATNMAGMFEGTPFNQDISSWDVSHVTNMESMFLLSSSFNQDISSWDVSSVANMSRVFEWSVFNQPLDLWDTSSATTMSSMFMYNDDFNQDISSWDTSNVTNMANMFNSANNFDQNISNWNVSKVTDMQNILSYSGLSSENYDALLIEWSSLNLKNNVALGATNITYCNSESQRQYIVDNYSWAIADNGRACGLPVVETGGATNITHNSAVLALNLVSSNSGEIQSLGLQFGEDTNYGFGTYDASVFTEGLQEINIDSLNCESSYHFRAFATTNAGTTYGNDASFTTDLCPPPPDLKLTTILNEPGLIQGQDASYTFRVNNVGLGDAYPGTTLLMMIPNSLEIISLSDGSSYDCFEYLEILESPSVAYHADTSTPYVCEVYDFELYESDAMLTPGNSFLVTIPFQVVGEVDSSTTMYAFTIGQEETDSEDLFLAFEGTEDIFTLPINNIANYTGTIPGSSDPEENTSSDSDPIPDSVEDAAPGNGDGNNDGTPDSAQSNVTSLPIPTGSNAGTYVTLVVPEGSTLTTTAIEQATALATKDSAYDYPLGLMSFTVSNLTPGSTIPIELYYYTSTPPNSFTPRKYNSTNQTYTTLSTITQTQTSLTKTTINNQPVLKLSYQLQDGGPLDQDNIANGTIIDPVGLAQASVGVPDTGL